MEMTEEQTGAFFNQLHATGELSDGELDNRCPVCGYNCWEVYGYRTPSFGQTFERYKCAVCAEKAKADTTGTAKVPTCEAIPALTKNAKSSYVTITL